MCDYLLASPDITIKKNSNLWRARFRPPGNFCRDRPLATSAGILKSIDMTKSLTDPLRVHLLELTEDIAEHVSMLRDFATTPGNAWLAKGELQQLTTLLSDMESLLEDIKQADLEAGY